MNRCKRFLWIGVGFGILIAAALLVSPGRTLEGFGVHLPMIFKDYPPYPLVVSEAWTTDESGTPESQFAGGETIQYHASGSNTGMRPIEVELSWRLSSYCGEMVVHTETVTLEPGEWTAIFSQTAPACSGITIFTFQASFSERQRTADSLHTVTNPVGPEVWARPAFDKCDNPSISQMQTWWTYSPYWAVNIYIGGIHRACANLDLTPEWVRSVLDQGWALIPTWVGPQAPCSNFAHRFSSDPTEAYQQGRAEADAATAAAAALGLTSNGPSSTIIYYDLEGYSQNVTAACRTASKSFINGWVERMHELGSPAGAYGAACASYVSDWDTIANVPDDAWIAYWTYSSYNAGATVWDLLCVSNSLWDNEERLRQYAGGHNETWGTLTMNIDSNVTLGEVLALLTPTESVDPGRLEGTELVTGPEVADIGAVSAEQAWILLDEQVYWSEDGGASWVNISPGQAPILAATFLDPQHGWLASASGAGFNIWRTTDGRESWQEAKFMPGNATPLDARPVALDFTSPQEGWIALKLAGSANFNRGMLFHTSDGGMTWEERSLPGGGRIDFVNSMHGWTLTGPEGDVLYETQDGGWSWQPASSSAGATLGMRNPLQHSLAGVDGIRYVSRMTAWAYTRIGECEEISCTTSSAVWRTLDGGVSWIEVGLPGSP